MIGKKINQLATELAPVSTDLTIIGDPTTGVSKKITLAQIGSLFSGAVAFYTNLASFPATGSTDIIYCAKDTQKLYLWSGSDYTEVFPSQALLDTYQLRSEKGVSNGYASLDSTGKVPISQLPSSIMEYKGTWNAATNTPTLANGTGDTGDVYICNVAGTVNFGAGPLTFAVGDYVIYSGTIWQRSSGAVGTVTSVAVSRSGDALSITGSPITTSGTINIGFAGTTAQYLRGDGTLATFPSIISQAQNLVTEVYNSTGATLTKGTIVYINGGQGNLPTVTKAIATGDSTSAQTYGIVQADITNMNNGYVVVAGRLSDLDTQAYTAGTQLYLSATTAGTWTSTKQYAPNHLVYVGIVVRSHPTQGIVEVKIQNGYELDELHDVAAQTPSNNDGLFYESSTSLWKNKSIATILGGTPVTGTGTTNTLPKFTAASTIGNSNISDNGSLITIGSNSYVNGALAIGTSSFNTYNKLNVGGNATGNVNIFSNFTYPTIQSDVTSAYQSYRSAPTTAASVFTLSTLLHYIAINAALGSGSVVTNQYGFIADNLTSATNNYGFYGNIPAAANRWNLYMNGTANNYMAGALGIGVTVPVAPLQLGNGYTESGYSGFRNTGSPSLLMAYGQTSVIHRILGGVYSQAATVNLDLSLAISKNKGTGSGFRITSGVGTGVGTSNNYLSFSSLTGALDETFTATEYMRLDANGALGIGTTSLTNVNLGIGKNITGATTAYNLYLNSAIQSDVTTIAYISRSQPSTQAASFNLTSLFHYVADQGTIGAGSTITNQYGFTVGSSMVGATNTFAFRSAIAAGTGRWNIYMDGTANNYMAGSLGIGSTAIGAKLQVNNAATVGTGSASMTAINPIIFVDNGNATNGSIVIKSHAVGAGNVVGALRFASSPDGANYNYAGIEALSSASSVVEILSFKIPSSNGSAGTSAEIVRIDTNGLSIGTQSATAGTALVVGRNNGRGIYANGTIPSTLTTTARYVNTAAITAAATFTLSNLQHYFAEQGTFGAGSTVTNQFGFFVDNTLTGATNNYGFYGNIPSGTNRWNIYMNGTANNYMAGSLGIGATALTGISLYLGKSITGATTSYGVLQDGIVQSSVTSAVYSFISTINTAASAFTLSNYYHFFANQQTIGATSSVTNQYGFVVASTLTGATNNYGFYGNIADAENRWNLYMNGTAANYLNGVLTIGTASPNASAKVQIDSTTQGFLPPRMTTTQRNAISSPATGLVIYDTVDNELDYYNGTSWQGLLTLGTQQTVTGFKQFSASRTASLGVAQGTLMTPTLTASANNDVLVGLDISPTYSNGAFTGVTNTALRVIGNSSFSGIIIQPSGTSESRITTTAGSGLEIRSDGSTSADRSINFKIGTTTSASITSGGNVEIATGSIKTGAPSGGTAQPWKLGTVYTGTCVPSTFGEFGTWFTGTVIEIEVNGTTYKIPAVIDNYC